MNSDNDELPKPLSPYLNSEGSVGNTVTSISQTVFTGDDSVVVSGEPDLNSTQIKNQPIANIAPLNLGGDTPIADDSDLIEKEWIVRLKAVVERNINDPYNLNIEVDHIKEDYQKKRYNREPVVKA